MIPKLLKILITPDVELAKWIVDEATKPSTWLEDWTYDK